MAERGYILFRPRRAQRPYTFLYPADWELREIAKDGFTEIFIAGPLSQAGTYTVSFSVRASSEPTGTPEGAAVDFLARYRSAYRFKEVRRTSTRVAGSLAIEVEIAYSMLLPLNSVEAKQTLIRERRIFLKQGGQLYELLYAAPEEDYETWLGAFHTLVQSFAFPEEPADRVFYRPVETAVPQYVREESPGYEAEGSQSDGKPEHDQG